MSAYKSSALQRFGTEDTALDYMQSEALERTRDPMVIAQAATPPNQVPSPQPAAADAPSSAPAPAAQPAAPVQPAPLPSAPEVAPEDKPTITESVTETVEAAATWSEMAVDYLRDYVFTVPVAIEVSVIVATGLLALLMARPLRSVFDRIWPSSNLRFQSLRTALTGVMAPLIWVLLLWAAASILKQNDIDHRVVRAVASLVNAWVLIRLFASVVRDAFWARVFSSFAWMIAALNILGLLDPTVVFLDSVALNIGATRLSLFQVIKGALFAGVLLWLATAASRLLNARINSATALTPSVQILLGQMLRLALLFGAVMIALSAIGIDLTALAVFSGAVGVGIGFGLQSVFSNLVAGIILLFERSIKVGDFVELNDGIQGTVREITIRSTLVTTNDNIDVLVPNSEFITKQMTNWTLRDAYRRLRIPFGVAYGTDKDLVKKAGLEAASEVEHTLTDVQGRDPKVWLVGFGDSSLDFELVVWLKPESVTRPAAVHAAYCWAIESALAKYEIEIPFPQRDLHIRSGYHRGGQGDDRDVQS